VPRRDDVAGLQMKLFASLRVRSLGLGVALLAASCIAGATGRQVIRAGVPTLQYDDVVGCGNMVVYAVSKNRKEYLVVFASRPQLGLSPKKSWFDLIVPIDGLRVQVDLYRSPPDDPYCTDVADANEAPVSTWKAIRGTLRIHLTGVADGREADESSRYWAHIRLERAAFQGPSGEVVVQEVPLDLDAEVGWMEG